MQLRRSSRRLVVPTIAVALATSACSAEDLVESGIEEAIERSAESEGGGDVELDLDLEDGNVRMEIDGGVAQMGSDLEVPDWVPGGFPLPDDLSISMAAEENGETIIAGSSSAAASDVRDDVIGWLEDNGYEVLVDLAEPERFRFVAARGDDVLEGDHAGGGFQLMASQRDVTYERQDAAEVREGAGTATASVGEIRAEFEGTCRIQGGDYLFDASGMDGSANLSVYAVGGQPPSGSAFVMTADVETSEFVQYSINFPMGNDDEPQVSTGDTTFGVSGTWFDLLGGEPVQGGLEVTCDP
jgi:hypothetical protein